MSKYWILDKDHAVVEAGLMEWARFFEDHKNRRVRLTSVGPRIVSTVFLGLSHNFDDLDQPLSIFETMVYGISKDSKSEFMDTQLRCDTWEQALAQHEAVIEQVKTPGVHIEEEV